RESEERFRNIFNNAAVSIWEQDWSGAFQIIDDLRAQAITDFHTYFEDHPETVEKALFLTKKLDVNDTTLKLYGAKTKKEILVPYGKNIVPEIHEWFRDFMVAIAEGKPYFEKESVNRTVDGRLINIIIGVNIPSEKEQFKQILLTVTDITERKLAEKALHESEEKNRAILNAVPDLLFSFTKDGVILDYHAPDGSNLYASPEVFLGKNVNEVMPPNVSKRAKEAIHKTLNTGKITSFEYEIMIGDELQTYEARTIFLSNTRVLCVVRDITMRKQAEEEREKLHLQRQGVNHLQHSLLVPASLENKLKIITDSIVSVFGADFCRIWLIRPGDLCERDCKHAKVHKGPHVCRYRDKCLHLLASSGRYTHTDGGGHRRVPFGCYKIGRVASDEDPKFITNDVQNDPRVHNHEWARELGLESFAGYQLHIPGGKTIGVLALFARHPILPAEDSMLEGLGSAVAMVIQQAVAEEAVMQSEARYRILFENAGEGILIADIQTKAFIYANPAISNILGYSTEELLGMHLEDIHPKEDLEHVISVFMAQARGEITLAQLQCLRKNGEIVYANITTTKSLIDGRECNIGFFTDVTEKKRAEEELRISEEKLQSVFNSSPDAITVLDLNGTIRDCNPATVKMHGFSSKEELVGKSAFDLAAPGERQEAMAVLKEMLDKGFQESVEYLLVTKDGREFPGEVSAGVIHDSSGNPQSIVVLSKDVTERKKAQEQEQLERKVLERLNHIENTTDTIRDIIELVRESTGIEAVGIRLREDGDFPYYQTVGFPAEFVEMERYLCARDETGEIVRDAEGNPVLECMCGNILHSRTDTQYSYFTADGSFWSNSTTDLLASTSEKDRQARTRNRCNGEGYESVALIPLRVGESIIGLLQLNDRRRNRFTLEMIRFFEGLSASIGIALSRQQAEEALSATEIRYRRLFESAKDGILILDAETGMIIDV
ncbi:PAS domain S-box protein, partial [bacterium]|nr:PAS domain S-box protein [bacterium]